ncbi:hypothetical protein PG991_010494 [Apiospora marii]|uniref:Cytochrome P450 n=1 Tax=Apiospora marii TaxID=335849 RepID=A0ABR1RIK0_9PEZI
MTDEFWEAPSLTPSDIYQNPRVTKSRLYLFSLNDGTPFIFNALDRNEHLRKRKIIGPALSDRSMRKFDCTLAEQVDIFLQQLGSSPGKPVNLTDQCRQLTMDAAVLLAFGSPVHLQTKNDNDFILKGISMANYRINCYMNFPFLQKLQLDYLFRRSPMRVQWRDLVQNMIRSRLALDKHARDDLYSFVMGDLEDAEGDIEHSELFAESLFFMSAGGDTVSTAMSGLFFYLSRSPRWYNLVAEEVRTTFESGQEIKSGPKLASCRYLRACIDETLRMSPPIGGTLWRELAPEESGSPWIVDGHVIPPGTHVGVNTYAIHHNEEYFSDPFSFRPERWLADSPDPADIGSSRPSCTPAAFVPFSTGARSCAGKAMAYLECSLVAAKALWYFDFEKAPGRLGGIGAGDGSSQGGRGRKHEFQLFDVITSRHDGPYLVFKPRGDHHKEIGVYS